MVSFQNVSKVYGTGIKALDEASFFIDRGEFVFVVGPSGAGKSTITKLMYREEIPDSGNVIVNNFNLNKIQRKEIPYLRRSIGMVFQDFQLLARKTVYENVSFAMEVTGAAKRNIRRRVPEVLSMVGLGNKAKMLPGNLSGGEQQRVGIARALVNNPKIIIADEPTGNLDNETAWEIMSLLDQINKLGTTIIMVTHSHHIVDDMKKRVIAIEQGKIVRDEEGGYHNAL